MKTSRPPWSDDIFKTSPVWPIPHRVSRLMRVLTDGLKDLLFPPRCHGCGQQKGVRHNLLLCSSCKSLLSPLSSPLCSCCGAPFPSGEDHLCGICLRESFAFTRARSLFVYKEPVSSLLLGLKFGGDLGMLDTLSVLARQVKAESAVQAPDLIIPVPLHKKRLQSRGFNQALLLAAACFPKWQDRILTSALFRPQPTVPQTELSGMARRQNLRGAFRTGDVESFAGQSVLLVDDVFTTGSTVHECAQILTRAGARCVEAFTVARVLEH
ncbi:MAG: ComF family protein [Desulfobulbus sp.]|nr:MAG: ComF family protein [Desulfobulbus sp.]